MNEHGKFRLFLNISNIHIKLTKNIIINEICLSASYKQISADSCQCWYIYVSLHLIIMCYKMLISCGWYYLLEPLLLWQLVRWDNAGPGSVSLEWSLESPRFLLRAFKLSWKRCTRAKGYRSLLTTIYTCWIMCERIYFSANKVDFLT